MITYTLTDGWTASDPAQVDPALREQAHDQNLTREERAVLAQTMRDAATVEPDPDDLTDPDGLTELDALHDHIRPDVPDNGTYQVIALDAHRNSAGEWSGILNCRANGEHVQVRF